MNALVEVAPGIWLKPDHAVAVIAFAGDTTTPPRVQLIFEDGCETTWQFRTWEEAYRRAAEIANGVNSKRVTLAERLRQIQLSGVPDA